MLSCGRIPTDDDNDFELTRFNIGTVFYIEAQKTFF